MCENWANRVVALIVLGLLALEASVSALSDTGASKVNLETKRSASVSSTSPRGNVTSPLIRGLEDEESSSLMEDAEQENLEARQADCRDICRERCGPRVRGSQVCRMACGQKCVIGLADEEQNSAATKPASSAGVTEKPGAETDNPEESSEGPDSGEEGTEYPDATTPNSKNIMKAVPKYPANGLDLSGMPDQPVVLPVPVNGLPVPVAVSVSTVPNPLAHGRPIFDRVHPFLYDPFRFHPYRHLRRFPFRVFDESAGEERPESEGSLTTADEERHCCV